MSADPTPNAIPPTPSIAPKDGRVWNGCRRVATPSLAVSEDISGGVSLGTGVNLSTSIAVPEFRSRSTSRLGDGVRLTTVTAATASAHKSRRAKRTSVTKNRLS